jgi:hypothetical protein
MIESEKLPIMAFTGDIIILNNRAGKVIQFGIRRDLDWESTKQV